MRKLLDLLLYLGYFVFFIALPGGLIIYFCYMIYDEWSIENIPGIFFYLCVCIGLGAYMWVFIRLLFFDLSEKRQNDPKPISKPSESRENNPKPKKRMTAKEIDEVFKQDSSSNVSNS